MADPIRADWTDVERRVMLLEGYGAGDIRVGLVTGRYPNEPLMQNYPPRRQLK